ncbi:MAG: amidase [Gammaproteobacteria bacterium]
MHPADLSATEARRLLATRALSSTELVAACIQRIEAVDGALNAMVTRAFERALDEAAERDRAAAHSAGRGNDLGALHGLPVAIKDIQDTAGIATTCGSPALAHHVPDRDAGIVARIRAAGGIIIGKTNVPEHSIGANTINPLFGPTGNPFAPQLTCGGSSGGSAVAVATGMAPLATGSDHGGSLRIPACFSGVVGYRATPGMVPNEQRSMAQTFYSLQGPMARTVADAALLLSVIAARNTRAPRDPMAFPLDAAGLATLPARDLSRLRVGFTPDLGGVRVSRNVRATFAARIARISRLVGRCEPVAIDLTAAPGIDWHLRQDVFMAQWGGRPELDDPDLNPNIRATHAAAAAAPMATIALARRQQMALYQTFAALFDDIDLLVCPGVSVAPFPWTSLNPESIDGEPVTNYMAWLALTAALTVVGHPVVALPCGRDPDGLPFGVQVVGPAYGDHDLLAAAQALELAFAADPELARPVPDLGRLGGQPQLRRRAT